MRCNYQGRRYVQKQCKFFRRCMYFQPYQTGACNYMLIWVHEWRNACIILFRCMSEYCVDQSTATPTLTWSKTIILTYNQDGEPKRSKVKCQLIDPSIISLHTDSVLAMAPAVEAICGKWGDPTPNIRIVHAEGKYSFGLSSLYFSGFVVSLGLAICFILMKYHHTS
jgi:hypothetical protein